MKGARGEVAFRVGRAQYALCLTLGALAEIETALGCDTLTGLHTRLKHLSAEDLYLVLKALLRAGSPSGARLTEAQIRQISPARAIQAVAEVFRLALG